MVFGFLVVWFVLLFGVFLTNYRPTVLKHDFWRTFSSMPFYLILVFPCITVIIKSLYIKVKVYFHFIIQLSGNTSEQHSTPGNALAANCCRGNHWENITLPYTRRDVGGFLGGYLAFTIQNLCPTAEPNHSSRNYCEGETSAEHFLSYSEWEGEIVGPLLQTD